MGFRPEVTIYNIDFKESSLEGLEMRASACTVDEYNKMLRAAVSDNGITEQTLKDNDWILRLFIDHLVSWNLDHPVTGEPVPTTYEAMLTLERSLVSQMVAAWQMALVTVPKPSNSNSSSGENLEEQSLGLGSSSESLQN